MIIANSYSFDEYDKEILKEQKEWIKSIEDYASIQEASSKNKKDLNLKILPLSFSAISFLYFRLIELLDKESFYSFIISYRNICSFKFLLLFLSIFLIALIIFYIFKYIYYFNKVYTSSLYKYPSKEQIFPTDDENFPEEEKKYYRDIDHYVKKELELRYDFVNNRIEINNTNEIKIDKMILLLVKFIILSILLYLILYFGVIYVK